MRNHFIIIQIFLVFITLNTFAQDKYCNCNVTVHAPNFEMKLMGEAFINNYPDVIVQFYKSWMQGDLLMSDSTVIKNKILRYNCLYDELIWIRLPDYKQVTLNKKTIVGFKLYSAKNEPIAEFKKNYFRNSVKGDSSGTFLQILAEGKIILYVQRKVIFLDNTGEFQNKDQYYLQKDGELHKFEPNRRNLYGILGDENTKMKKIVRRNFLFVKNESDLINAIQLFNKEDH